MNIYIWTSKSATGLWDEAKMLSLLAKYLELCYTKNSLGILVFSCYLVWKSGIENKICKTEDM